MYKLPIVVDSTIKTECWTYYKTCILETNRFGQNWLSTHMNIFLDSNNNAVFGDGLLIYPLQYFEPILKIQSADIGRIKPDFIVDYIKKSLHQNYYIVIDCNIAKISFVDDGNFEIHEILIYGYDDSEKVFLSPLLNKGTGKPEVCKISYDRIQASYKDIREYYINNPDTEFGRSYSWYYPITRLKLSNQSVCKSGLIYGALKKLNDEYEVEYRTYTRYNAKKEVSAVISRYVGIGCLFGLESILSKTLNGEYDLKSSETDLTLSLLRLYEHRQNLIQTLKLLDLLTRGYISKSGDLIDQYITLSEKIKKCYSISKKWYITGKSNLLNDMIDILSYNREHEVYILRHCFDIVHKYLNGRRNNGKKQQQEKV